MNRRDFSSVLAACGLVAMGAAPARAQGGPVEGTHYVRLARPAGVAVGAGKIEVLEFFWYGCPHCRDLEPALEDWVKALPPDVAFRRVPVGFTLLHEAHQRLFFSLEAMGKLDSALHRRIFTALHDEHKRLEKEADQVEFVRAWGLDPGAFRNELKGFYTSTKMSQAKALVDAYKIDGVPALGIHGRFYTAGSLAGDNRKALAVADFLVQRIRKGG
jgi:thiol:disulfide interchange protein DsbA